MNTEWVRTEQLQVGDTIEVGWRPYRDTITALRPYEGSLRRFGLVQIASFALNPCGMTLEVGACFRRIVAEQRRGRPLIAAKAESISDVQLPMFTDLEVKL